jgi:hypothetical protein
VSKTPTRKTLIDFTNPDAVRKFLSTRASRIADEIVNYVGALNIDDEDFDNAVTDAIGEPEHEASVLRWRTKYYPQDDGPLVGDAAAAAAERSELELTHMIYRGTAMYLIGLAVGRQIGGAR